MSSSEKRGRRSIIWDHFDLTDGKKKTVCRLCKAALSYSGGKSTMRNHMKRVHKRLDLSEEKDGSVAKKRQTSLKGWHTSVRALGKETVEEITRALALMCAIDIRPTSIVEGEGFRNFC
ncbi:uncharacterized protein LOC143230441 [Tachypleus tridentatus]|uniref:uncharacterized protein LOC143230441 n=1 Tax=Tachypleus tridentatus TaxID=6853 RepID=UPI003FD6B16A